MATLKPQTPMTFKQTFGATNIAPNMRVNVTKKLNNKVPFCRKNSNYFNFHG